MVDLSELPDHLNEKIVCELDIISRLTLRKTASSFRLLVDKDRFHIKQLDIEYTPEFVTFYDDRGFRVMYKSIEGVGTEVRCGKKRKVLEGQDYVEVFQRDLMTILNNRNLTIGILKLEFDQYMCKNSIRDGLLKQEYKLIIEKYRKTDERVMDVFKELEYPLKVTNLRVNVFKSINIKSLFVQLDPNSIKSTKFFQPENSDIVELLNDPTFSECAQFKNLRIFSAFEIMAMDAILKITHCSIVRILSFELTEEEIEAVKNALLKNPELDVMRIIFCERDSPIYPGSPDRMLPVWQSALYPKDTKKNWIGVSQSIKWNSEDRVSQRNNFYSIIFHIFINFPIFHSFPM